MKRLLSMLMAFLLLFSVCAFAEMEDDDGDDSNPVPMDMMEEEELEEDEEILEGRMLRAGDQGDDVLALQTRLKDLGY